MIRTFRQRNWQLYEKTTVCLFCSYSGTRLDSDAVETKRRVVERPRTGRPHPRNAFQGTYDMDRLVSFYPLLGPHIIIGPTGRPTVDWADPIAVRALNTALLVADYDVNPKYSDILPPHALVPPVPGRADYVHHIADALQKSLSGGNGVHVGTLPTGTAVIGMDIGTGASCIYPTIATSVYGWRMIASDINSNSIASARDIVRANGHESLIDVRYQEISDTSIFDGVLRADQRIDFAMCNPPFYSSMEAFQSENARKIRGLSKKKSGGTNNTKKDRVMPNDKEIGLSTNSRASSNNFGGSDSELWCEGGEVAFVKRIISESKRYWDHCLWFSSLVSRSDNLTKIESYLRKNKRSDRRRQRVQAVQRVRMGAGRKSSTILMWSFLSEAERREWAKMRNWG
ncbi:hypothetical protein ACHAXR_011329 [Thalassiosira sp. AJA248-18]